MADEHVEQKVCELFAACKEGDRVRVLHDTPSPSYDADTQKWVDRKKNIAKGTEGIVLGVHLGIVGADRLKQLPTGNIEGYANAFDADCFMYEVLSPSTNERFWVHEDDIRVSAPTETGDYRVFMLDNAFAKYIPMRFFAVYCLVVLLLVVACVFLHVAGVF